jgi:hypothetical protein
MTEYRDGIASQPPTRAPSRRRSHRRRHPAAGTRKLLAAGSVAATLGLSGALWAASEAQSHARGSDEPTVTSDDDRSSSEWYSQEDEYESDAAVSVSPSANAPDTTSRAS